ncbi:MAG: redoxin domain-containing protein [Verrucomicrobiales bacterium]|nr:redoxin domain-containing protein [Verrucomicrobiales bacterium]
MRTLPLHNLFRPKSILPGAVAGFLVIFSSCQRSEETQTVNHPAPEPDAFCGLPVPDFETAIRMIQERRDNFPKVGEPAIPFSLPSARSEDTIALSDLHREKPVVLIFGSGSCSVLGRSDSWIPAVYDRFNEQYAFALIYIREAHPTQGYRPAKYAREVRPVLDAESLENRRETAARYAEAKALPFPVLVDTMNDETARVYSAWPVRLFVVDTDGTVLYSGGQAPWFYHPFEVYQHQAPVAPELQDLPRSDRSLEQFLEFHSRQ